jgi:dihydroxy-acid dehydratase
VKQSAASPELMVHRGRALVWDDYEAYLRDADDPDLDVEPGDVLVLRGAGPKGYPGMPEIANLPLPAKMLAAGVTDMVRISDARMSGTSYGTVVLHVCPESAVGGPLAAVRTGDVIELDVPGRRLHLDVSDDEIARRLAADPPEPWQAARGYQRLYVDHVLQADEGADFDFLVGAETATIPRRSQ